MLVRPYPFLVAQSDVLRAPLVVVTVETLFGARVYSSVGLTDLEVEDLHVDALTIVDDTSTEGDGTYDLIFIGTYTTPARGTYTVATSVITATAITDPGSGYVAAPIVQTQNASGDITATVAPPIPVISIEPRVISFGNMRDTGSILPTIAVRGRRVREAGNMEVTLRNDDDHFGKLLAQQGGSGAGQSFIFLAATLSVLIGFRGLKRAECMTRFRGIIQEQVLTRETFLLRAETA